jgi:hypothetical protein
MDSQPQIASIRGTITVATEYRAAITVIIVYSYSFMGAIFRMDSVLGIVNLFDVTGKG